MTRRGPLPTKPCTVCGRTITWRAKWQRDWEHVRYCSDACRRGLTDTDRRVEQALVDLLAAASKGASVCPSQAARAVSGEDWCAVMPAARSAARRLVSAGAAEITQGGRVVDGSTAKGPIRVRPIRPG